MCISRKLLHSPELPNRCQTIQSEGVCCKTNHHELKLISVLKSNLGTINAVLYIPTTKKLRNKKSFTPHYDFFNIRSEAETHRRRPKE